MTVFEFLLMLTLSISTLFVAVFYLHKITANSGHNNQK